MLYVIRQALRPFRKVRSHPSAHPHFLEDQLNFPLFGAKDRYSCSTSSAGGG
jgi:hypothetical protein